MSGAEDPEKILDQAVVDLQGDLIKMRQASAQVQHPHQMLNKRQMLQKSVADTRYLELWYQFFDGQCNQRSIVAEILSSSDFSQSVSSTASDQGNYQIGPQEEFDGIVTCS